MPAGNNVPGLSAVKFARIALTSENATEEAVDDTGPELQQSQPIDCQRTNRLVNLNRRVMRDFHGLESADLGTHEAIINFSFFLAQGEIDAAFKSMKLIRSTNVWQVFCLRFALVLYFCLLMHLNSKPEYLFTCVICVNGHVRISVFNLTP